MLKKSWTGELDITGGLVRSPHGSLFLSQGRHPVSSAAESAPPAYHLGCDMPMQGSSFQGANLAAPRASLLIILRVLLFSDFQSCSQTPTRTASSPKGVALHGMRCTGPKGVETSIFYESSTSGRRVKQDLLTGSIPISGKMSNLRIA